MRMKKKTEITLLNVLLCLMVIFIHISSELVVSLEKEDPLYMVIIALWRLCLVVVPGFIMLSGVKLFLKYKNQEFRVWEFYKSRLLHILIPYIFWVIIYFWYECVTKNQPYDLTKLWFYLYSGEIGGHLYFVVALVQFYILMPLWIWLFKQFRPALMLPFMLMLGVIFGRYLPNIIDIYNRGYYYLYADRIFTQYLFWWTAGCYIGLYYEEFVRLLKKSTVFITVMYISSGAMVVYAAYLKYKTAFFVSIEPDVHMLYTMSALLFLYRMMLGLKDMGLANKALIKGIDRSSYYIYLSHVLVINETARLMDLAGIENLWYRYGIKFLTAYGIVITICIVYTKVKQGVYQRIRRK